MRGIGAFEGGVRLVQVEQRPAYKHHFHLLSRSRRYPRSPPESDPKSAVDGGSSVHTSISERAHARSGADQRMDMLSVADQSLNRA